MVQPAVKILNNAIPVDEQAHSTCAPFIENNAQVLSANNGQTSPSLQKLRSKIGQPSNAGMNCQKKPSTLPNETVEYLKAWMMSPEHIAHPYPTEVEKAKIMEDTGLELKQLTNWFVNNRKRYWKPRVEAHLLKDQDAPSKNTPSIPNSVDVLTVLVSKDLSDTQTTRTSRRKSKKGKIHTFLDMEKSSRNSPTCGSHLISGHNSVASSSDGTTSGSDSDDELCAKKVTSQCLEKSNENFALESIDVHILRPAGTSTTGKPELSDVTVLSNVPPERILKTFFNCSLRYSSAVDKKSPHSLSRRDTEIVRLKKNCLSSYLAEQTATEVPSCKSSCPITPDDGTNKKRKYEVHLIPSTTSNSYNDMKSLAMSLCSLSPRPKYRRYSIDVWKEACQTANHVYDDDVLPSLEEATRLFGYAS